MKSTAKTSSGAVFSKKKTKKKREREREKERDRKKGKKKKNPRQQGSQGRAYETHMYTRENLKRSAKEELSYPLVRLAKFLGQ